MKRTLVALTKLGATLALWALSPRDALAQNVSCAQARACCEASAGGARCAQLAQMERVAPQACAAIYQNIVSSYQGSGRPLPVACGGSAQSAAPNSVPTNNTTSDAPPPNQGASNTSPQNQAPVALPPELATVSAGTRSAGASDEAPACMVVRVRGSRVMFSDESSLLELRCVGLPGVPARVNGDPASFTPGRAPGNKTITVTWSVIRGGGTLAPNGNTAAFTNAAPRDGAEDTELRVRVAVTDRTGRELGQNTHTVIVRTISRDWTLEVNQRFETQCWESDRRSVVVGYSLVCDGLRVPLRVNNDGTIQSTASGTCTNRLQRSSPCMQSVSNIEAPPPDVVSGVQGNLDRASGVVTLHLGGAHYGGPNYTVAGRVQRERAVDFLVPPLMLESVNGSSRTFAGPHGPVQGSRAYTLRASATPAPHR
ncbi:MAG: hypothetical protein U0269_23090 [Polyangiales bacterium]